MKSHALSAARVRWGCGALVAGAVAPSLQKSLHAIGSALVLRKGPAARIIAELARETGANAVFWNEMAQAPHQAVADQVAAALKEIGVTSQGFPGDLLVAPAKIRNKENRGLRVFTPFWRRVQALGDPPHPCPRQNGCVRDRPLPATASKAGALSRRIRIGPADCAKRGGRRDIGAGPAQCIS